MVDAENAPDRTAVEPVWDQNRDGRDEPRPSGTSGGRRVISGGDAKMGFAIAAVAVATGIVNALSTAQDAGKRGDTPDIGQLLFWEMTSIAAILVAVPVLVIAVRRILRGPGLAMSLAIAAGALAGFSAIHIAGMIWLRKLGLWLAGGHYEFGLSAMTVLYEFRKDVVTALVIAGAVWLFDTRRMASAAARAPELPPKLAAHDPIWLRDGTSRIRVEPRQILWIASAGNYVEYRMDDGTTHLIRGTLASAEAELGRFRIVRVHRTRLANLDRIVGVDTKPSGDFELAFDNGQTLGSSRRYRSAVAGIGQPAAQR